MEVDAGPGQAGGAVEEEERRGEQVGPHHLRITVCVHEMEGGREGGREREREREGGREGERERERERER